MPLPLKCRCGAVRGEMQPGRAFTRATCLRRERASPFLDADGQLLREPAVISREQRKALEEAGG